jgi:hypothetical protein
MHIANTHLVEMAGAGRVGKCPDQRRRLRGEESEHDGTAPRQTRHGF